MTATPARVHYKDEAVTVWAGACLDVLRAMPDESVDAVVTDPPYGLANTSGSQVADTVVRWVSGDREYIPRGAGFMGNAWDAFVPPVAVWDECYRVLRPGGHVLAFAGSRTLDLMALGIRLAGFDLRDSIAWLYGSGFPKSLDVSDAVARWEAGERHEAAGPPPTLYVVTEFLRAARDRAGWTNRQIDALFGTAGMAGHWTTSASQPAVPSLRQWEVLREHLGFGDDVDHLVRELASTERPEDWGEGESSEAFLAALRKDADYSKTVGWGTALKPSFEPIAVGRKPLVGTVAANVLTYGTGALNIDGCRVGPVEPAQLDDDYPRAPARRWPANVVVDTSQAEALDRQSGVLTSGKMRAGTTPKGERTTYGADAAAGYATARDTIGDSGGASRFFPRFDLSPADLAWQARLAELPTFRYEAKAPKVEKPRAGEVAHPTVKPLDLMRWLVRLVTPKGGLVLDPFAGSGTTAEACVIEGFRCVTVEQWAPYLPLIVQRLSKPIQPGLDLDLLA